MRLKKTMFSVLIFLIAVLFLSYGTSILVFAKEPTPQSGTNTYTSTNGFYNKLGFSLMIGSYTTSISQKDAAYISASETSSPVYPKEFQVTVSNGARYIQGSVKTLLISGSTKYINYNILLHPKGFNPNSAVKGRSLLDNLSLESGVNKTTLGETLAKGNTEAWVNGIFSIRTTSGARSSHATFYKQKLWSDGKSNYSPYPDRVYSTSAIKNAMPWSSSTQKAFDAHFNNKYILPAIIEADGTPPSGTFSPNSSGWTNSNINVSFNPSDSGGSGVKRWRWRASTDNGKTYGSWSNYINGDTTSSINLTTAGQRKIQVEVEDNAGNKATKTSGTYNIDKTAPSGSFSPNSASWTNGNVAPSFTPSDNSGGSGVYRWRYRKETNGSWGSWTGWNWSGTSGFGNLAHGTHRFQVEVKDNAGNTKTITSGYYYIDTTNPSYISSSISGEKYKNGNDYWIGHNDKVNIKIRGSDADSGLKNTYLRAYGDGNDARSRHDWSGTDTNIYNFGTASTVSIDSVSRTYSSGNVREAQWVVSSKTTDVNMDIHYYFTDIAGNTVGYSDTGLNLKVDGTSPTGALTQSPTGWTNGNVTITAKGSDSGGSGFYRIKKPDGTYTNGTSATYTVSNNGTYTFVFYDNVGNSTSKSITVSNIDKTAPSGSVSANTTSWTKENVTLTATGNDSGGSGFYRIKKPDGTYANSTSATYAVSSNGTYTFVFYDNAGNSTSKSITVSNIDKTAPSGSVSANTTSWTKENVTLTATGSDSGGSGFYRIKKPDGTYANSTSTTYTVSSNGTYTFVFYDNVGNSVSKSITVNNIDKVAPEGTLTQSPTGWTNGNVTITAKGSDSGGSGFYRIKKPDGAYANDTSATYSVSNNGTYTFVFYDNAGNSVSKSITVNNIDKVAPEGTLTQNPTGWTNKNVTLTATGSDSGGSGFYRIKKPDGTYANSTSVTYAVSSNGTYTFVFYDNAGNSVSKSITVNNIDKVAPEGTLTQSPTGWTNGNVTITAKGSDSGVSGFHGIMLPSGAFSGDAEATYIVTQNGTYTFEFYDAAGNKTVKSITVSNIDKEKPNGSFSPNSHAWTNKNVSVIFTPSDSGGSGVYRWRYRISADNGASYGNWSSYINGATASTINLSTTGNHKIQVEVVDKAGNSITKTSGTYYIDKVNPTASFTPNSHTTWTNGTVSVKVNVSDTLSGVKRWRWRVSTDNGATYDAWRGYIDGNKEATIVLDVEGVRRIQVEVEDIAGNVYTLTSGIYNIDKTMPGVNEQGISGDLYVNGNTYWIKQNGKINIRIRANDHLSLLESMILQLESQTDNYRQDFNFSNNLSSIVKDSQEIDFISGTKTYESADKKIREATFTVSPRVHGKEYTASVWMRDYAGNIRNFYSTGLKFKVDGKAPTLTVTGNPSNWTKEDVVLTATAVDPDSGVKKIILPDGTEVAKDKAQFTVTKNGSYTFIAEDNLGHRSTVVVIVDKIDKSKPTNAKIIINGDDDFTNSRNVVLTLYATDNRGVTHMRFQMDNGSWSSWVPYATSYNYTMNSGLTHQGTNRVYAQFRDEVGNVSDIVYDSIVFDNIKPIGEIKYHKNVVNTRNINLTVNAYDVNPEQADIISGLDSVRFRELQNGVVKRNWTSWEPHQPVRNWILSEGDGEKVIEMEVRDKAGNITRVSRTFVLDTLFIDEAVFTNIVNPPLGNPELPTSEVVKVKKGYDFTFVVKTTGDPDEATYSFNGTSGTMDKIGNNLFQKTLKIDMDEDTEKGLLPIYITVKRHSDGTSKSTTLKVLIDGSAYDDFNVNLTN